MITNGECVLSDEQRTLFKNFINSPEMLMQHVRGFTKEESDIYYESMKKLYTPLGVNIDELT